MSRRRFYLVRRWSFEESPTVYSQRLRTCSTAAYCAKLAKIRNREAEPWSQEVYICVDDRGRRYLDQTELASARSYGDSPIPF